MADSLTIDQMYEYCWHKEALQKQGIEFPFSVALEYCKNKFGVSPSSSTLSRVWTGRDQWESAQARRKKGSKAQRIRGAACDDFGADVEFMFNKNIAAILNKMMIERFRNKAQSTLDTFLV
jgi:hypothetical protein